VKISAGPLDADAVTVAQHTNPPRIVVHLGAFRLTLDESEAVALAEKLVDAIGQLRAEQNPNAPTRTRTRA
jgi:hypothetical protein